MPVAGRRAGRAVVDVSERTSVRRRAVVDVSKSAGVRGRAVLRMRWRERVQLSVRFMPERKARRMRLQVPECPSGGGRSLGRRMWRRNRSHCRLARTGGGARSRLRCRSVVDDRAVLGNRCERSRRTGRGRGSNSRLRRAARRGRRGRVVVRVRRARRSGHHHTLGRRRAEVRSRADRRQLHRPVGEQRHRRRGEQQRNRGHRHSSGDTPHREPLRAFVGRHRPSPSPSWTASPPRAERYKKSVRSATRVRGDLRCLSGIISDNSH